MWRATKLGKQNIEINEKDSALIMKLLQICQDLCLELAVGLLQPSHFVMIKELIEMLLETDATKKFPETYKFAKHVLRKVDQRYHVLTNKRGRQEQQLHTEPGAAWLKMSKSGSFGSSDGRSGYTMNGPDSGGGGGGGGGAGGVRGFGSLGELDWGTP